eukprot:670367-Rhodomonas_salina.4
MLCSDGEQPKSQSSDSTCLHESLISPAGSGSMVGAFQIACPFRSVNALTQRPFSDEESTIQSSRNGAGGWKDEGQRERGGVGKE